VRKCSLQRKHNKKGVQGDRDDDFVSKQRRAERVDAPSKCLPPLDVHSRDVRAAPLPLSLPNSATIDRGAVQVRASQRVELRACEVQRCPELIGRGKRVEVRRVDEGVVTAGASEEIFYVGFFLFVVDAIRRGVTGESEKT